MKQQLIYQKFSSKVKIDKEDLLKEINAELNLGEKNFLLSEIVFTIKNKKDLNKKYSEINEAIKRAEDLWIQAQEKLENFILSAG